MLFIIDLVIVEILTKQRRHEMHASTPQSRWITYDSYIFRSNVTSKNIGRFNFRKPNEKQLTKILLYRYEITFVGILFSV